MSKAKSRTAVREEFLRLVREYARYWSGDTVKNKTVAERCDGLAFSILNIFDGTTESLPHSSCV